MFLVSLSLPFSHWQDLIHVLSIPIPIHLPSNRKTKHCNAIAPFPLFSSSSSFRLRLPPKVIDSRVRAFDRESSWTSSISVEKPKPKQKTTCNSCGKVGNKLNSGRNGEGRELSLPERGRGNNSIVSLGFSRISYNSFIYLRLQFYKPPLFC